MIAARWVRLIVRSVAPGLPVVVGLGLALLIIVLSGWPAGPTAGAFLDGVAGSEAAGQATANVMMPLVLIGLAWIVATSANQVNLGLEGQILIGGVCATVTGTSITTLPTALHLPLALSAGVLGGALWAGLPALLSVHRGVSELLTTFMLNFIAALTVSWLVRGPLRDPDSPSLLQSSPVEPTAAWPRVGAGQLSWDVALAPLAVAIVAVVLTRTTLGFRLKLLGANSAAARQAGIAVVPLGATALVVSGAIGGLVGASLILASTSGVLTDGFSNNYGFLGIAVALLARNSPFGCIPSGLLFAALQQGAGLVETRIGVSSSLVKVAQGTVIVILAGSVVRSAGAR